MGVFAVAHILRLFVCEGYLLGEGYAELCGEIVGYKAVVHCRVRENFILEIFLGFESHAAVAQLVENLVIVFGVDDYGYVLIVFSRRANHGRSADIDVFNAFGEICTLCERSFEGI